MPTVEFHGFVIPREKTLNARGVLNWNDVIVGTLTYHIREAIVSVKFELESVGPGVFDYAYTLAFYHVRAVINAISFSSGIGFTLILENGVQPDHEPGPIAIYKPELAAISGFSSQEVVDAFTKERKLMKPLSDLADALLYPLDAFVNCARCIDGLCHLISSEKKREKRWASLRGNLNLTKEFLFFVTDGSAELRHGDTPAQSLADIQEATTRTWKVMTRFLEYRKRGDVPLPVSDFEIL